jgi:hypothetical protein
MESGVLGTIRQSVKRFSGKDHAHAKRRPMPLQLI